MDMAVDYQLASVHSRPSIQILLFHMGMASLPTYCLVLYTYKELMLVDLVLLVIHPNWRTAELAFDL